MNWISIDFETANASRNSACALGLAVVEDGKIVRTASWLICPPVLDFDPFHVSIHGITAQDVKDSPKFNELWPELAPSLVGKSLIAHNARFDISVLRHSLDEYRIPYPELDYYCTCNFCRSVWPGQITYRLDVMADQLGIQFNHHNPESDAEACAKIALQCCDKLGVPDLAILADRCGISRGRLYPSGYDPCSRKRKRNATSGSTEPFPTGEGNSGPLFVITGTLQSMTQRKAAEAIVQQGWRFKEHITQETSFLVVGEQDFRKFRSGNKSHKTSVAESYLMSGLPIEIISEDEFLRMLNP
jgi:DNA polymerase III subunit epsilon